MTTDQEQTIHPDPHKLDDQYGGNPSLVIHPALTEGKELYRAAS